MCILRSPVSIASDSGLAALERRAVTRRWRGAETRHNPLSLVPIPFEKRSTPAVRCAGTYENAEALHTTVSSTAPTSMLKAKMLSSWLFRSLRPGMVEKGLFTTAVSVT